MKILFFISSLACGGAERVVVNLANYWAGLGWDITVVTLRPESEDFYHLQPGVRRIALGIEGDSHNIVVAVQRNWQRVRALRAVLEELRPDIALGMMSTSNVLLALAARDMDWLRTIGSERCYPPHFPLGRVWEGLRRETYARLDAVVALTQECAAWITQHTRARYVPVIPNPINYPLAAQAPRIAPDGVVAPGRKILLSVGRLSTEKNFIGLINAFCAVRGKNPDWDLVILGEGPERHHLDTRICALNATSRIHMPGIAGNVDEWYTRSTLYVLSSHSEGFPNTLAEAMAHGLPAVSVDCNTGPRDIVRHGIDGVLVSPGDAAKLQFALDRMMHDRQAREAFALRAIDTRERFSMARIAARWEELFASLTTTTTATAARDVSGRVARKSMTEGYAP